ncbi:ribonucleoside-diphosphate reductase beta chain 2 [Trichinella spiralis]|uniref:ribonucleoside-diphosphate reductase beta chain 2 n=1 Tax=Trichinella spiralis TaxID=6334 RepID=UPI0001EFDABE|nr:ribonucleoside-diphosphate reductase beta chain 2 [Trichinella spiralis]
MNVHITASPSSRSSIMVFRKYLFRYFTAMKLRSALVEAIAAYINQIPNMLRSLKITYASCVSSKLRIGYIPAY